MDPFRRATTQHGLVAWQQLIEGGIPGSTTARWVRSGRLVAVQPRVYRVAGAPVTWHQRVLAAVLAAGPGAAASHRTAALLWTMLDEGPNEIVVPRGRTPQLRGVIVHQTRDPIPIGRRSGIPVTSPMRTIVARLCAVAAVEWELARVARPGRRGAGTLREVLDRRALLETPPDGMLEPRFARLLKNAGLPAAAFQHPVGRYEIDFAYPDLLLAIEVDGYGPHASRRAFQNDRSRQNELVAAGWTVLRFTWADVVKRPDHVARLIREAIGRAQLRMAN